MNRVGTRRSVLAALLIGFVVLIPVRAQPQAQTVAPDRAKVLAAARDIMDKARYCTMVTIAEDGQPQARVVDPFAPEQDMTVWIGTNPLTRKVADIRKNPRVTLLYYDTTRMSFVTLLGRAEIVTAADEKAKHWKEAWARLYKDRNRGDDYALVRLTPFRLEIVGSGFPNDPKTWRPMSIDLR
jgi:general stress protein 26